MIFYGKKNAIIWDSKADKPLIKVDDKGVIDTDDSYKVRRLKELGYIGDFDEPSAGFEELEDLEYGEVETVVIDEKPVDFKKMNKPELVQYFKDNNITGYSNKTVKELRAILKG